ALLRDRDRVVDLPPDFEPLDFEPLDFDFEPPLDFDFALDFAGARRREPPSPLLPAASGSPRTAARLSSSAAIRSGALVAFGSSETDSTSSSPRALRSISASSSSRYSSR